MKYALILAANLWILSLTAQNQDPDNNQRMNNPHYDQDLAQRLGGDAYGMKVYFFVILKTGPKETTDQDYIRQSFRAHLDNVHKLVREGKIVLAGPLAANDKQYRGIFILNGLNSLEEAEALLQTDLAIKNELLAYDIYTWYGSAALPEYLPIFDKIWTSKP